MIETGTIDATTRAGAARILVNTIPKAGTHLLEKVVRLLPGCAAAGLHVEQFRLGHGSDTGAQAGRQARFEEVPLNDLERELGGIRPGDVATGHLLYSQPLAELLLSMEIKLLGILRDPRDIAVSYAQYVAGLAEHYLFSEYQRLAPAEQLMTTIIGITDAPLSEAVPYLPMLMDIGQMVRALLPWQYQPNTYTTSFEQLVGPAGGGTRAAQIREITNIARHIGVPCSEARAAAVADQLFGGSATFRKGMIGDWRNHFTPEHTRAFKRVAGDLLMQLGYEASLDW
jgi:hypothetical protein